MKTVFTQEGEKRAGPGRKGARGKVKGKSRETAEDGKSNVEGEGKKGYTRV